MRLCIALSVALLVSLLPISSAQAVSFQGLGDLPGGLFSSTALGISSDGSTVVGRSASSSAGDEAFIWDATNGMQGLGDLPGGNFFSVALGISGDGSVVVGGSSGGMGGQAFSWTSGGGMVELGKSFGSTVANGISDDGSVVVGMARPAADQEAFRWTVSGGAQGLGDLPGGTFSSTARGTSSDGSVVVGWSDSVLGLEVFIWDAINGMQGLGFSGGSGQGISISGDGSVVVGNSAGEAFIWDATNGMQRLGRVPGGLFISLAQGISLDGSTVVGQSTSSSGQEAFIWDSANGMREFDLVLTALGLDITGWRLDVAHSVSADGHTIAGFGINPSGQPEAWIAVIPEPGTALLMGLGLLAMGVRGRPARGRFPLGVA